MHLFGIEMRLRGFQVIEEDAANAPMLLPRRYEEIAVAPAFSMEQVRRESPAAEV